MLRLVGTKNEAEALEMFWEEKPAAICGQDYKPSTASRREIGRVCQEVWGAGQLEHAQFQLPQMFA